MFAYSFLAMTSYNIVKPITRSRFIASLGADNLPYVQLGAGLLIGVLMQLYSGAAGRLPRRAVIPATQAGLAVLFVVFWFLFRTDAAWVSVAFYVLGLVLGILLISQFWTLASDIFDARQAKRLFGFVGGGASLGGATGAALTAVAVEEVGTNNLLLVSAVLLGLCVAVVTMIVRRQPLSSDLAQAADERGVGGVEAVRLLRSSRHLQVIAMAIGLAAIGAAIIEQQLNMAAESQGASSIDAITSFLAQVTFYLSIVGFVVQVVLTPHIHRSLGLIFALLLLPISLGATAIVILLNGAIWAPAVARVLDTSLRYTVDKTTREVLFLPLPADLKYRAKPFVDVTVDRFAKALGALLLLVLIKPWGLGLDWQRLSVVSLVVMGLWIAVALRARRGYLTMFRRSLATHAMEPATLRLDTADAATIETLVEELSNPDESSVLYAIDMLEALSKRNLVTPLLLHHESPRVRARALLALESSRVSGSGRWIPVVIRMLNDEDADVRAASIRALAALGHEDAPTLMRGYLNDSRPRIAVTAAAMLADSTDRAHADAAYATLTRLIDDTRRAAAAGRREAATALARVRNPACRTLLMPLVRDEDIEVAREAIRSVRAMAPIEALFVPGLIALLGHRVLKSHARDALVSGGEGVLDALAHFMAASHEDIWVRRHVPATLALLPMQRSMDILLEGLGEPDGFLRYKVVEAIGALRRRHPALVITRGTIEAHVVRETSHYYSCLTLRYNIKQHARDHEGALLTRSLDDKLERTLDRIFRLLALIYPWDDVAAARHAIAHGDAKSQAAAVEYMDSLLAGAVRRRVMPIIENIPMLEKVQHANLILKTRPRDLDDTVAQLVHDDDAVVAACAIHFVARQQLWSLADDLEYVLTHRSPADTAVVEAAAWALTSRRPDRDASSADAQTLPAVELVDRLRGIPLFEPVSIDELFRIAGVGRQVQHDSGRHVYMEGDPPDAVHFLLDGSVHAWHGEGAERQIDAAAALAFEEMLEGRPRRETVRTVGPSVCLTLAAGDFLTMFSDNIVLAQGLLRMLLVPTVARQSVTVHRPSREAQAAARSQALQPIDKVLLLRQHPLFARATVDQLLDLVTVTREVSLTQGSVLFSENDRPLIHHVLRGEVRIECRAAEPILAGPGHTIGVAETLAGIPFGQRATVTVAGQALRLDYEDLFNVLADHIDLLQGLFSGVLSGYHEERSP